MGGMGIVYEGLQPLIGKRVAIKVLRPDVAQKVGGASRFISEARASAAIRHRGIIDVFGFGELPDGGHYMVMEYLEGKSLEQLIREHGRLAPLEAVPILDEVLSALAAAHRAGVVHRDLKPSNIFIASETSRAQYVKLLDFGMAKRTVLTEGAARQSGISLVIGTPDYLTPEQATGKPVGPAADLYALGVVAFEKPARGQTSAAPLLPRARGAGGAR